jgi:hypothetical protein
MPSPRTIIRRRLCQACFCLGCLLPTTALLGWTASRKLPGHVRRCEEDIADRLGMVVRLKGIDYPQPGVVVYEGFELFDPETGRAVLNCRSLEAAGGGQSLALDPLGATVQLEQVSNLARLVMRRLRREALADDRSWQSPPRPVTLRGPHGEQTYEDVEFVVESAEGAERAWLRFRLPQQPTAEVATLSITRRASTDSATTRLELDTGGAALPLAMFAPWLECQSLFGAEASFRGTLWIDDAPGGSRAELRGELGAVDLDALVAARFPHVLTGRATLRVDRATVEEGRLMEASGSLSSPWGMVGESLLNAAVSMLGCRWSGDGLPERVGKHRDYRSLTIPFQLDAGGLRLGRSGGPADLGQAAKPSAILHDVTGRPLLLASGREAVPLVRLIQMLVPLNEVQVPATKETASLIPWLPVAPVRPAGRHANGPTAPAARVRLGDQK